MTQSLFIKKTPHFLAKETALALLTHDIGVYSVESAQDRKERGKRIQMMSDPLTLRR